MSFGYFLSTSMKKTTTKNLKSHTWQVHEKQCFCRLRCLSSDCKESHVTLEHKTNHRYICSNSQQYNVWVKIIHFSFMPKIITVNISKLIFLLVICIAMNFIWTTLKVIFSIFWFFCTLRFQIYKYLYLSQILSYHNTSYINGKQCINLNDKK